MMRGFPILVDYMDSETHAAGVGEQATHLHRFSAELRNNHQKKITVNTSSANCFLKLPRLN